MGLRDSLIIDWKGKFIEYEDVEFYVVDQFEYNGKIYLYVINSDISEEIKILFLEKEKENIFSPVDSGSKLLEELMAIQTGRVTVDNLLEQIGKIKK